LGLPRRELPLQRDETGRLRVYDPLRKGYFVCTPEEEVRQQLIRHLTEDKSFPAGNIAVEREFRFGNRRKRFDLLVFGGKGQALLVCECKAPHLSLNDDAWYQLAVYNAQLGAPYQLLTNGPELLFAGADQQVRGHSVPDWKVLLG